MRTYYVFRSESVPDLRGYTDEATPTKLPADEGPWTLVQQIAPGEEWLVSTSRAVVAAAIMENGFYLSGPRKPRGSKSIIESDRIEGTAVFDRNAAQIGTIKRLMIEKVSGRVLYVDVTFGGFLGIGAHHHTIPWGKLSYDWELGGYRTDITEEQVRGAPSFFRSDEDWHDRKREQQMRDYWDKFPPAGL